MTESRTTRLGLPIWSAGTDAPSRTDFNEAFTNLESRAAYDDGVTYTALPGSALHQGRTAWVNLPGGYRTAWRRDDASTWYHVGGPTIPTTQLYRGLVAPVLTDPTLDAIRIEHPDIAALSGWAGNFTYAGQGYLRSGLMLGSSADNTLGRLGVGGSTLPTSTERAVIRAYGSGEHALTVHALHGSTPGNLLRLMNSGGAAVLSVDGSGRLTGTQPSVFGGASLASGFALAVAPTQAGADTNGLLLYGQSAATSKAILRMQRDAADTAAIALFGREGITLGRLPWGTAGASDGRLTLAGDVVYLRGSGANIPGSGIHSTYTQWRAANPASPSDPDTDIWYFAAGETGIQSRLPMYVSQELAPSRPAITLYQYTNPGALFMELARHNGSGFDTMATWDGDGRVRAGANWKGTGVVRDARQALKHTSTKRYTAIDSSPLSGQAIPNSTSYTYEWAAMTPRSSGAFDLDVVTRAELVLLGQTAQYEDSTFVTIKTEIQINGAGAWSLVGQSQASPLAVGVETAHRAGGPNIATSHRITNLTANTFKVRTTITMGVALVDGRLRELDITAEECLVESYTAP